MDSAIRHHANLRKPSFSLRFKLYCGGWGWWWWSLRPCFRLTPGVETGEAGEAAGLPLLHSYRDDQLGYWLDLEPPHHGNISQFLWNNGNRNEITLHQWQHFVITDMFNNSMNVHTMHWGQIFLVYEVILSKLSMSMCHCVINRNKIIGLKVRATLKSH